MELYIKQKVFSLGDKYDVYNAQHEPVYHVHGELFSWGAKIHLYDLGGNELYYIKQKVFALLPEYTIFQGDTQCARIKQQFSLLHPKLSVESSIGDFEINGNFVDMDYTVSRNGERIGEIHKKWLSWGDTYLLSVSDPKEAAFFTALTITIDSCLHNSENNR